MFIDYVQTARQMNKNLFYLEPAMYENNYYVVQRTPDSQIKDLILPPCTRRNAIQKLKSLFKVRRLPGKSTTIIKEYFIEI